MMDVLQQQAEHWHIYAGIIVTLILTGAGLPIPEEIPIVTAGVLSSGPDPTLDPAMAFLACLFGAIAGDTLMYSIGRFLGRPFMDKYAFFGRLVHAEREQQMENLIRDHGLKVFFVARFMIGVRAPMYLAAGMMRVPLKTFLLFDGMCATIVVGVVFMLSMVYGDDIAQLVHEYQVAFTILVAVAVLIGVAIFLIRKKRRKQAEADDIQTEPPQEVPVPPEALDQLPDDAEHESRAAS